jgi:Protein of unknown function (DUF3558)
MRFVVALLVVSGVLLVACGQPPVTTTSPVTSTTVSLAGLNACALLTGTQLADLRVATTGQPSGSSGSHCFYPAAKSDGTQLTVELVAGKTTTGRDPSDQRVSIGRHTAVRSELPMTGQCDIDILAGRNIVMVIGTGAEGSFGPACTLATAAARLIEPNLP